MSTAVAARLDAEARAVAAVWRREIITLLRERLRLVLGLAQPMLLLAALGIGLGTAISDGGSGVGYVTFLFPGVMVMAVQSPAFATGASILEDRELGFLREMLMAPVRRESLMLGKVLAGTTTATCHGGVLLAFAGAAGVPYDPALFTSLVAVLVLASFALTSLGALLAVCLPSSQTFQATTGLFLGPLVLLSGVFFPLSALPSWLTVFTALNPLTHAVDAARHTLTAHLPAAASDTLFANLRVWGLRPSAVEELAALACFGALCLFLAVRRFSRPDQQEYPRGSRRTTAGFSASTRSAWSGYTLCMGKHAETDEDTSARIQSAADRDPRSDTAQSGFDSRAQSAADRCEAEDDE